MFDPDMRWRETDETDWLAHCKDHENIGLYYGRIYTKGEGYDYSETNNLISNFKIPPTSSANRRRYKDIAISTFVEEVVDFLKDAPPEYSLALIPIPPSKAKDHPDYDDRVEKVAKLISQKLHNVDFVPLLYGNRSVDSYHSSGQHRDPDKIYKLIDKNKDLIPCLQGVDIVFVLDDILTSGAHFSAARKHILEVVLPEVKVRGLFWARTVESED